MKILALDLGSKSCGIALSDCHKIIAHSKESFYFKNQNWEELIKHLKNKYINDKIEKIIIGMPLFPSGDKSSTSHMVERFYQELIKQITIDVILVDEFRTTKKAHNIMLNAGLSRQKRKKYKDKIAAVLILQDYLDKNKHKHLN